MLTGLLSVPSIKAFLKTLDQIAFRNLEKDSIMQWLSKLKRRRSRM
jgi:hypothetical protein